MFRIRSAANAVGFSYCIVAVFAALAISSASHATETTLASWNLIGVRATENATPVATTKDDSLTSANLAIGSGVTAADTANSFTGCKYTRNGTEINAESKSEYLEIRFVVSATHNVSLSSLDYALRRVASGPASFKWVCVTNSASPFDISQSETLTEAYSASSPATRSLTLSSISELPAGTEVSLRLLSWGATSSAKDAYFGFTGTITLSGTAEEISGGDPVPLSVAVEDLGTIFAGVSSSVALTYAGDNAVLDISADTEIAGTTNYVNGVFSFTPDDADIGKTITFTATVSDSTGENSSIADTFTATVVEKPFIEDFEKTNHNNYYTTPEKIVETAATWQGTNFQVNVTSNDGHNGARAAVFRSSEGYIEMTTDKAKGAGSISFWHGIRANAAQSATASFVVKVSNNGGITWTAYVSDPIASSHNFSNSTLENVNVGGSVRVKFEVTCSHYVSLDDILITDYDGPAIIEPAIGEIADRQCYDDESVSFEVGFFGDDVAGTITNISATAGVASSEYSLVDGVFTFTPSEADLQINGGIIEFTITLSVPGRTTATRQFCVTVKAAPPRFLGIAPGMVLLEDFDSIGTDDTASLPAPWKVAHSNGDTPDYTLSYALASDSTTQRATNANGSISAFTNTGIYNLGTNDEDRAVGFVSGGSAYQTCALMVPVKNVSTETLSTLFVSYSVEKWRKGAGKRLALYSSMNGSAWTAIEGFETTTETDFSEGTTIDKSAYPLGEALVIDTKAGKFPLSQPVAPQGTFYLGWFYTRPGSSGNGTNGQCLGVDDVRIRFCGSDQTVLIMK